MCTSEYLYIAQIYIVNSSRVDVQKGKVSDDEVRFIYIFGSRRLLNHSERLT